MFETLKNFLTSEAFIPHGHCYLWKTELVWFHIISDASIALAYYSIPLTLVYFVRKRQDFPFIWILWFFGAFIVACGTTHVMEIWTLWHPNYWLSGLFKAFTALISIYTSLALIPLIPKALALPSPAQLEQVNKELEHKIIERKRVEEALRESEERYRAIVEDQTELIAQFQPDGTLNFINEAYCRYFRRSHSELIGNCYQPVVFSEDLVKVADLLNSLNLETPFGTIEHRVVVAGEVRWMQWMNRAIFDEQGNFVRFQSVGRDITERKQMEEALRQSEMREREKVTELALALDELKRTQTQLIQAEKMSSLGQMIAGIAHEINNPVSFIYANIEPASEYVQNLLNLLELYQQHYPNPVKKITEQLKLSDLEFIKEDFPKLLVSMNDGAVRISQIVMSLKNFSHYHEAKRKQVNIHEGLDNTLLLIQHRLKQHPLHPEIIVMREYGQLPKVECFPSELNQAFMNILCNAIDALDELAVSRQRSRVTKKSNHDEQLTKDFRPIIRICTEVAKDSRVLVRIADNGVGIKPEVQPKIFDPFFTTKPPGKGTGLGLSICYQIVVEKHGGELTCHSVYGEGTELVLKLPMVGRLS